MSLNRGEFRRRSVLLVGVFLAAFAWAETASAAAPRVHFRSHAGLHRAASFHGHFHGGGWGWGWYSPWWGPWGYYGYPGYSRYARVYGGNWTAVKTDVEPDEAALYLDGKLIGTADDFDGFPDELYLQPGRYHLEFRLEGYEPYSVEVDAAGARRLDIDFHLKKIPGAKNYGTYTPAEPPGGIVRYFAKRGSVAEPYSSHDIERYNRPPLRRPEAREEAQEEGSMPEDDAAPTEGEATRPGDLHFAFDVAPPDAAIYVDGRFAGTARELDHLAGGFEVTPGEHEVTVVCPGYREVKLRVKAEGAEPRRVRVRLSR